MANRARREQKAQLEALHRLECGTTKGKKPDLRQVATLTQAAAGKSPTKYARAW